MRKAKCDRKKQLWSEAVGLEHHTKDPTQSSGGWAIRGAPPSPGPGQQLRWPLWLHLPRTGPSRMGTKAVHRQGMSLRPDS